VNVQRQIARLESLLSRIQRNAAKPRADVPRAGAAPESGPATDRNDVGFEQRPTTPPAGPSPADTGVDVVELEMSDEEIVEIAVDEPMEEIATAGSTEVAAGVERAAPLANELSEEPAPESAPRPAAQVAEEAELEPPVKTPPPESGRQVVASPIGVSGEAEFNDASARASFEPDLSGGPISQSKGDEPSAAQLGETVELEGEGVPAARIELLSAPMGIPDPGAEIPTDELELSLPQQQYGGSYDKDLAPPSRAADDLARHRAQLERAQRPPTEPPVSLATPPSMDFAEPKIAVVSSPAGGETTSPVVVSRPALGDVQVAEMRKSAAAELPSTFLELLDASLSLEA
jgi:hypothetical protein